MYFMQTKNSRPLTMVDHKPTASDRITEDWVIVRPQTATMIASFTH